MKPTTVKILDICFVCLLIFFIGAQVYKCEKHANQVKLHLSELEKSQETLSREIERLLDRTAELDYQYHRALDPGNITLPEGMIKEEK